jgi:L-lactate dehydrogenase complex protein LldE
MRVALFVPCYIDQLYPEVGFACLELLEACGLSVHVPAQQTCCGQVLTNRGALRAAVPLASHFEAVFAGYEHIVCPSGSCAAALRRHPHGLGGDPCGAPSRVLELCQFLLRVVGIERLRALLKGPAPSGPAPVPRRVSLHESCHGLRELGLGQPSELSAGGTREESPARQLLRLLPGLELVTPSRPDECCGFGGSFSVAEPELSARIGSDRLDDFQAAGAEIVTSVDMSCLMHLSGLMRRQGRACSALHVAQLLRAALSAEVEREVPA